MSELKIYRFPDIVLKQKAKPIDRVEKSLGKLADDMLETMYGAPGIGLAANQVGILNRIIVLDTEYESDDFADYQKIEKEDRAGQEIVGLEHQKKSPIIMINPEIIYREGEVVFCEGCLSVPDYSAEVKRAEKVKVEYQDLSGLKKTLSAEGLQAICIQHEIDHLDGKLFIERLSPLKREMVEKKLIKARVQDEDNQSNDKG